MSVALVHKVLADVVEVEVMPDVHEEPAAATRMCLTGIRWSTVATTCT